MSGEAYRLVRLPNGHCSVHSVAQGETFHPVVGPVAEGESLYVAQLRVGERAALEPGEFVVWDVGLGAAGNAVAILRAAARVRCRLRLISFDHTIEPLRFALDHAAQLEYPLGYAGRIQALIDEGRSEWEEPGRRIRWELCQGDFPAWLASPASAVLPPPHAVCYDPFSPARNPAMWTLPLFRRLHGCMSNDRPCAWANYSRSTLLRVTLLQAGFFVGRGRATGEKEETTVAANRRELVERPLDTGWLARLRRSTSAEPLLDPVYRQAPVSAATWEDLQAHPQFLHARR
ncbi:MAG TPA: MnmC family methyltransferase [Candidatus Paceibacterota bacterium]|nr:MnmC family methyltransferase [Verrucomicrobiota bacterium]HRZ46384.1 MnmC family methyltransferase [Candidatus Paceibacterota bacterium]